MLSFDPTVNPDFGTDASITDASGQRLAVTDRYADLLMRSKDDLLRMPWQAIAHPDDLKSIATPFNRMVATGEPYKRRCRLLRGDGQWIGFTFRVVRSRSTRDGQIIMQSHATVDEPAPETVVGSNPVDAAALASYIRDMAQQFGTLSGQHGMPMLRHLLSLVSAEAGEEIIRLVEQRRVDEVDPRVIH